MALLLISPRQLHRFPNGRPLASHVRDDDATRAVAAMTSRSVAEVSRSAVRRPKGARSVDDGYVFHRLIAD
jgi:hypothetical protein